jgi:hypothetical protein
MHSVNSYSLLANKMTLFCPSKHFIIHQHHLTLQTNVSNCSMLPHIGLGYTRTKDPGYLQKPPSNRTRLPSLGMLLGPHINPQGLGRIETRPLFHCKIPTTLAAIKYFGSKYITTWSICEMCSCIFSFISHWPESNQINIGRVAVK